MEAEGVQVIATPAPETSGIENIYTTADIERRIARTIGAFRLWGAFSNRLDSGVD